MTRPASEPTSPRTIGRRLALGFGSVSLLAIALCTFLVLVIDEVADHVASMRRDESSIRQGMQLSTAVRELRLSIAQTAIEGAPPSLDEYAPLRDRVRSTIQSLAAHVPPVEHERLEQLGRTTQTMHERFVNELVVAARKGDWKRARRVHLALQELGEQAARDADWLARVTTRQMAHAHDDATSSTRVGLIGGGLCALFIVGLSIWFTTRLRKDVLRPLDDLTRAALHYGQGDFSYRSDAQTEGEFAALESAFSHMADELARRESKLIQNERMAAIGQMAAGIAHEINNPIGIIRGYLKTMSPEQDAASLREELAILDEEAMQCQRLADDLLSYARADKLSPEPVQLAELLRETARRSELTGGDAHIEVEAEDTELPLDGSRMRQVLLNLLNNARQASPEGAPIVVRGQVDHAAEPACYRIEVIDQGPGIDEAERARIFEPFYSTRKGGSGLGLAVCQGIVRAHGGQITADAASEGGAVLRIELPLGPSAPAQSAPAVALPEAQP